MKRVVGLDETIVEIEKRLIGETMNKCMMLHNRRTKPRLVPDGEGGVDVDYRMRPSSPSPDKHWTSMVLGRFGDNSPHIQVCGSRIPGGGPELWISRHLKDHDEEGFVWLMNFIESEDIAFSYVADECSQCEGHSACVALPELLNVANA